MQAHGPFKEDDRIGQDLLAWDTITYYLMDQCVAWDPTRWSSVGFSDHFAGYFKNEKNEKKGKERKRERITGSQQFTFASYILISVQVIKCSENLPF